MKYLRSLCVLIPIASGALSLNASSITAYNNQTAYVTTNHVFRNNEVAQGFVRLNNGFTVMPHACVNMDVVFSVSGDIDLRETSTIRLLKDLKFDSGVTLTTGGNIDGRGHTLILNGDFRIPDGKVLHFNGNTIIDAHGHEIVIGENAEIFVDTNVTLTIANAIIKTLRNAPTYPALRCGALTSKLALDNVIFAPSDDFWFQSGQLFVHNDVMITGTSAVVYHSPVPSYITKNSCLYLDQAVTFSVVPATFTDAPYALKNTYTDCNFIKMADETAALFFNGCTLQITDTGLRFTKGILTLDDRVEVKTDPTLTLTSLSLRARYVDPDFSQVLGLAWSPDGRYLAGTPFSDGLKIFSFDGISLTNVVQVPVYPVGIAWSPDGKYLAADAQPNTIIYRFNGSSVTLVSSTNTDTVVGLSWSHDGKFLAIATSNGFKVYAFDGTKLTFVDQKITSYMPWCIAWSPDDRYILITNNDSYAYLYEFNGTKLTLKVTLTGASYAQNAAWSPDGRYAVVSWLGYLTSIYRFDGNSLIHVTDFSDRLIAPVDWSPDGNYILTGSIKPFGSSASILKVYKFDGQSLMLIPGAQINYGSSDEEDLYVVGWSPNGQYVAAVKTFVGQGSNTELCVYTAHFTQTTTQALTNSFVLGDSAKGENYDTNLRLQPGASLNVSGKMLYDNVG
jgi:WD40 repeat protein